MNRYNNISMSREKNKPDPKKKLEKSLEAADVSKAAHGTEFANASEPSSSGILSSDSGRLNQEGSAVVI